MSPTRFSKVAPGFCRGTLTSAALWGSDLGLNLKPQGQATSKYRVIGKVARAARPALALLATVRVDRDRLRRATLGALDGCRAQGQESGDPGSQEDTVAPDRGCRFQSPRRRFSPSRFPMGSGALTPYRR